MADVPAGPPPDVSRAEVFLELGRLLEEQSKPDEAEAALRTAVADGGETLDDPRVRLAAFLARRGDRAGADDILGEVWRSRPTDPWVYLEVAQLLRSWDDLAGALRWANTGAFRHIRLDEEPTGNTLLVLEMRRQLRDEMGFPEDEYDLLALESDIEALDGEDDDI